MRHQSMTFTKFLLNTHSKISLVLWINIIGLLCTRKILICGNMDLWTLVLLIIWTTVHFSGNHQFSNSSQFLKRLLKGSRFSLFIQILGMIMCTINRPIAYKRWDKREGKTTLCTHVAIAWFQDKSSRTQNVKRSPPVKKRLWREEEIRKADFIRSRS